MLRLPWQWRFAQHFETGVIPATCQQHVVRVLLLGLLDAFGPILHSGLIAITRQIADSMTLEVAGEWWATDGVLWAVWQETDRAFADALNWAERTRLVESVPGTPMFRIRATGRRWLALQTRPRSGMLPPRASAANPGGSVNRET